MAPKQSFTTLFDLFLTFKIAFRNCTGRILDFAISVRLKIDVSRPHISCKVVTKLTRHLKVRQVVDFITFWSEKVRRLAVLILLLDSKPSYSNDEPPDDEYYQES